MRVFWETVLFAVPGYKGDLIDAHVGLHRRLTQELGMNLEREHFDHWAALFSRTVDDLFEGPTADKAKRRAARMADQLHSAIGKQR